MTSFQIKQGDEVELVVRRKTVSKALEPGKPDETREETFKLASVRAPEDIHVIGGSISPEFEDQKRFLVIKLAAGQASG